jgi:hypothetical protein
MEHAQHSIANGLGLRALPKETLLHTGVRGTVDYDTASRPPPVPQDRFVETSNSVITSSNAPIDARDAIRRPVSTESYLRVSTMLAGATRERNSFFNLDSLPGRVGAQEASKLIGEAKRLSGPQMRIMALAVQTHLTQKNIDLRHGARASLEGFVENVLSQQPVSDEEIQLASLVVQTDCVCIALERDKRGIDKGQLSRRKEPALSPQLAKNYLALLAQIDTKSEWVQQKVMQSKAQVLSAFDACGLNANGYARAPIHFNELHAALNPLKMSDGAASYPAPTPEQINGIYQLLTGITDNKVGPLDKLLAVATGFMSHFITQQRMAGTIQSHEIDVLLTQMKLLTTAETRILAAGLANFCASGRPKFMKHARMSANLAILANIDTALSAREKALGGHLVAAAILSFELDKLQEGIDTGRGTHTLLQGDGPGLLLDEVKRLQAALDKLPVKSREFIKTALRIKLSRLHQEEPKIIEPLRQLQDLLSP